MKGIVFNAFLEFLEGRTEVEQVERLLAASALSSGGAYTSVGVYPDEELVKLLQGAAELEGVEVGPLLEQFGEHLFRALAWEHEDLICAYSSVFHLLRNLDAEIHAAVRAIHPDATTPHFDVVEDSGSSMVLLYDSPRGLVPLAHGLLQGCFGHFGEQLRVRSAPVEGAEHQWHIHVETAS